MSSDRASPFAGPYVRLVRSAQALARERKRIGVLPEHAAWEDTAETAGLTWTLIVDGEPHFLVYIAENKDAAAVMGTIAHESVHVAEGYLRFLSEHKPGEETRAYLVGAVTSTLVRQLASSLARSGKRRATK